MVEIADFETVRPVEPEVIDAYRDTVPGELVQLWERYGYGTFAGGYLRVIDPREYEEALGRDGIGRTSGDVAIPILVTAMADLITWEPPVGVVAVLFRDEATAGIARTFDAMLALAGRGSSRIMQTVFKWGAFPDAVERYGTPAYDEAFVHVPLRSIGGDGAVESLKTRNALGAIAVMLEMQGPVEH